MQCLSFAPLYVDLRSGLQGWAAIDRPVPGLGLETTRRWSLETFGHRGVDELGGTNILMTMPGGFPPKCILYPFE